MSFENKGSMAPTVTVSMDPDRSGNYVCSGVADDVEIQLAIAYALSIGGSVFIRQGTYDITAALTIAPADDNLKIYGEGDNTILLVANNAVDVFQLNGLIGNYIENVEICDLKIQGAGIGAGGAAHGIIADHINFCNFHDLTIEEFGFIGIRIEDGTCYRNVIQNNIIRACQYGVYLDDPRATIVSNNEIFECTHTGVLTLGAGTTISDNVITYIGSTAGYGISAGGSDVSIVGNQIGFCMTRGISISAYVSIVTGNVIARVGYDGVTTDGGISIEVSGHHISIVGNDINHAYDGSSRDAYGIVLTGAYECEVVGNTIWECPVNAGTGYGIWLGTSDRNDVSHNTIVGTTAQTCYGIYISDAASENNRVLDNQVYSPITTIMTDSGTGTVYDKAQFQFTEPIGAAVIVVASPTGIDVEADTEGAVAWGQIPGKVLQVMRVKIWGVALDAPIGAGGQMHLEITFNAGASNAAYNTAAKSWTLANFDGEEADYVANDVVHWVIEDADVGTELTNLVAGDSFELLVMHEAGADPDGATDCLFRVVEVEYV